MAYLNNVRDGRQSKVYLLKFGETASTIAKGKLYAVKTVASSGSKLGNLEVGDIFVATSAITPASGDTVEAITPKFLGGATDKDLSFEKSTTEITCDKDDATVNICDGKVSSSGSITAYDLLDNDADSGINIIRKKFNKMVTYGSDGTPTGAEGNRSSRDVLLFLWDARDLEAGQYVALDIVPALITSQGHAASYGSGQTMPLNFTGNDTDDEGHKRSYHQFEYFTEFGTEMGL